MYTCLCSLVRPVRSAEAGQWPGRQAGHYGGDQLRRAAGRGGDRRRHPRHAHSRGRLQPGDPPLRLCCAHCPARSPGQPTAVWQMHLATVGCSPVPRALPAARQRPRRLHCLSSRGGVVSGLCPCLVAGDERGANHAPTTRACTARQALQCRTALPVRHTSASPRVHEAHKVFCGLCDRLPERGRRAAGRGAMWR